MAKKKSFKSLPKKAQKAAFAQMDDDGTRRGAKKASGSALKPKSKKLPNKGFELLDRARVKIDAKLTPLIAEKKQKYSNVDISSAMSADEKRLTKEIATQFSRHNSISRAKRLKTRGENKFVDGVRVLAKKTRK